MKRTLTTVALAGALALGTAGTALADVDLSFLEKNNSGVSASGTYGDRVVATASRMDPDKEYVSYVYGAGSDADGANPCILTGETLAGPANTVGTWTVDENGNGTLNANAPMSEDDAGTISIRENDLGTNGAVGPNPADTLVACAEVGDDQRTPLGDVQDAVPQLPSGDDPTGQGYGDLTDLN